MVLMTYLWTGKRREANMFARSNISFSQQSLVICVTACYMTACWRRKMRRTSRFDDCRLPRVYPFAVA